MDKNFDDQEADTRRRVAMASLDAFARDSTAFVKIGADEAAAASLAYGRAKQQRLSTKDAAQLMACALASSDAMKREAFKSEFDTEFKRGVVWDVLAGTVPAVCILLVLWVVADVMQSVIGFRTVVACAAALLVAAVLIGAVLLHPSRSRWVGRALDSLGRGDSRALAGSVGALAVGSLVVATAGGFLSQVTKERQRAKWQELSVELRKVDTALAMTLAAKSVRAEPLRISALVEGTTGLDWTIALKGFDEGHLEGDVLARAKLQGGEALVRYLRASKAGEGTLQTELVLVGRPLAVRRYLYGIVEAPESGPPASLRQVRLRLNESTQATVLTLPANTLPPAPGTLVLAREKSLGILESIQSVDDVRQSLLQGAAPLSPTSILELPKNGVKEPQNGR